MDRPGLVYVYGLTRISIPVSLILAGYAIAPSFTCPSRSSTTRANVCMLAAT